MVAAASFVCRAKGSQGRNRGLTKEQVVVISLTIVTIAVVAAVLRALLTR